MAVDASSLAFVRTPGAMSLLRSRRDGDQEAFFAHLNADWLELWYAFESRDLRALIEEQPAPARVGPSAALLISLLGGSVPAPVIARSARELADPRTRLSVLSHDGGDLRLKGRPAAAMEMVEDAAADVRRLTGPLVDSSDGLGAIYALQAGTTALLAGELRTARSHLLAGHRPAPNTRFPFVSRDIAAKTALVHAVSGEMGEAKHWARSARDMPRSESWVETLIDDSLWLVDYICAVEDLDLQLAETLRQQKPSPLSHLEWWGVALQVHVRHLVLTGRVRIARDLCDAVAQAGLPLPGSDSWQAVILTEARVMCAEAGTPADQLPPSEPLAGLARHLAGFVAGRFEPLLRLSPTEVASLSRDARVGLAIELLRVQAMQESGAVDQAGVALEHVLTTIAERGTLSVLRFLTPAGLDLVAKSGRGAQVAELVAERGIALLAVPPCPEARLSDAERAVVELLVRGRARGEMASDLCLSVNTVKSQLASAYRKLGVRTKDEAVAKARLLGME